MKFDSISESEDEFLECVNEDTKPANTYFDAENQVYRFCYETCATCETGGNIEINNCKTCDKYYILKPDVFPTTNCVLKCPFYY